MTLDLQAAQSDWWARGSRRERGGSRVGSSQTELETREPTPPGPCVGNPPDLCHRSKKSLAAELHGHAIKAVAVGIGVQFHRRDRSFYCSYTAQGTASERARQRAFAALGATASLFFWAKSPPRGIRKPELPEARVRRIGMDS